MPKKTSRWRGVSWCRATKKWKVCVSLNNKTVYIGTFKTQIEAAKAYNHAAKIAHGSKAKLNRV